MSIKYGKSESGTAYAEAQVGLIELGEQLSRSVVNDPSKRFARRRGQPLPAATRTDYTYVVTGFGKVFENDDGVDVQRAYLEEVLKHVETLEA